MNERRETSWELFGKRVLQKIETKEVGKRVVNPARRNSEVHKAPTLAPEFEEPFSSVQAAITARLLIEGSSGNLNYPLGYGEMGSGDTPINELNLLNTKYNDGQLVDLYIKRSGNEEAKNDADYRRQVVMALGSIRGATPIRKS